MPGAERPGPAGGGAERPGPAGGGAGLPRPAGGGALSAGGFPPPAGTSPTLASPRRIHIVGVGGSGMSGIASVLAAMGHRVTGSDLRDSPVLERLAESGVATGSGHDPSRVAGADLVAVSSAVPADDPEVMEAARLGLPVLRRAEILAGICATRRTVAVAGTHGKTTTSSMLAVILVHAGADPSYVIGGDIAGFGPGARWGGGDLMVVEADESDGTFLELGAEAVVVTSLEPDHLEHYGSFESLQAAFDRFVTEAPGPRVISADDRGAAELAGRVAASTGAAPLTYGSDPSASWRLEDWRPGRDGSSFTAAGESGRHRVEMAVPGLHNARNALAALAMATALGVDPGDAAAGLAGFSGVGRRFERRGERGGVTFVDDYGHLPGEVRAALAAARDGGWRRVVAVFQPHRYSRTEALWETFATAFADADVVVVTGIYSAGEAPRSGVSGDMVAGAVRSAHPGPVLYVPDLADLPSTLAGILEPGDVCVTLGAGDLTRRVDDLMAGGGR